MSHIFFKRTSVKMHLFLSCFILLAYGVGCTPPPSGTRVPVESNKVLIQVLVRDEITQLPIKDAQVRLLISGQTFPVKLSDEYGLVTFNVDENLLEKIAEFEAIKPDYEIEKQTVTLDNAGRVDIYMSSKDASDADVVVSLPTKESTPHSTSTLVPTNTATPTNTSVPTDTPTPTFTPTPTATPTQEPTLTPEPSNGEPETIATALMNSSIFEEPNAESAELEFIFPGDYVVVLEQTEFWILVRDDNGVEGWAAANRFDITLGTPTPVPIITAVSIESASIFEAPNIDATQIAFINSDVQVRVLGRSANSSWLFIRTENEVEGWVAASLMELAVDVETLPVIDVTVQSTPSSPGSGTIPGSFSLDFWSLPGQAGCSGARWMITLFLEAHGGDAPYTYYVNDELVAGSVVGNVTKQFSGADSTARIYRARVVSSTGQVVTKDILVTPPNCD